MAKRKKDQVDGLALSDLIKIRSAVRRVWSFSYPRRLVVARAKTKDGFAKCEKCKRIVPKITVDHIEPIGKLEGDWIERMFVPSNKLQALCSECHRGKTKVDLKKIKRK